MQENIPERLTIDFLAINGNDLKRVFKWVLSENSSTKKEILGVETKVVNSFKKVPGRTLRIITDNFRNSDDKLDICALVFIIERLKKKKTNVISKKDPFYTHYEGYKKTYEKMLQTVMEKTRKKSQEIEK